MVMWLSSEWGPVGGEGDFSGGTEGGSVVANRV